MGRPGAKSAVNPVLYDLCKYVRMPDGSRVIEGEGGGIREAIQALRDAGLRPPRFIDTGIQFSVIISRHTLISEHDLAWLSTVTEGLDLSSEERAILVSMRHGGTWHNTRVRQEFAPLDSVAARRTLQRLVDTGLAQSHGERGNTAYTIARRHAAPSRDEVLVKEVSPAQPTVPTEGKPGRRAGRNTQHILEALDAPKSVRQLVATTGLTDGQVRFALNSLIDSGQVEMLGAQGVRSPPRNPGRRGATTGGQTQPLVGQVVSGPASPTCTERPERGQPAPLRTHGRQTGEVERRRVRHRTAARSPAPSSPRRSAPTAPLQRTSAHPEC